MEETSSFAQPEKFAEHPEDDLCCGHMGRAEALLYASRSLGDERFLKVARALAIQVTERARTGGSYRVTAARGSEHFSPSLFQGHAGIGYTLLRLARPGALPCPLLLE
jgi:lantibiotic modifying enzyme